MVVDDKVQVCWPEMAEEHVISGIFSCRKAKSFDKYFYKTGLVCGA